MNGGHIILADEPTGALDSHSGAEVMTLLDELASQGHVVILITHDREVAARAKRIIEIRDGEIISDTAHHDPSVQQSANASALQAVDLRQRLADGSEATGAWKGELLEAVQAAWREACGPSAEATSQMSWSPRCVRLASRSRRLRPSRLPPRPCPELAPSRRTFSVCD